jgi:hypothetical protein
MPERGTRRQLGSTTLRLSTSPSRNSSTWMGYRYCSGRERGGQSAVEASTRLGHNSLPAAPGAICHRSRGARVEASQGEEFPPRTSLWSKWQGILDVSPELRPPCHRTAHLRISHATLQPHRVTPALQCSAGEMSLVGPRPEGPERTRHYSDWHRQRLSVKPGITGLAQVHGLRDQSSSEDKPKYDLQYILAPLPVPGHFPIAADLVDHHAAHCSSGIEGRPRPAGRERELA